MKSGSRTALLGIVVALAIAVSTTGCAKRSNPTNLSDDNGSGQVGDAPADGLGAQVATSEPTTTATTNPPSDGTTLKPSASAVAPPPVTPLAWPAPADCISHNPATVSILYTAASNLWQVVDGGHAVLAFKRAVDADQGLELAKTYKKHCFVGRGTSHVMDYWLDPVKAAPAIASADCLAHDPAQLKIVDLGAPGWRVETTVEAIVVFATKQDAEKALMVMKHYNRHCYIGRGYTGSDRLSYLTTWFANA